MLKFNNSFASFSVNDLDAAKQFYRETLGLNVAEKTEGLEVDLPGGGKTFLYRKPNHAPATFTVLNFKVNDVSQTVDDLAKKGIQMEHYDGTLKTDKRGIFHPSGPQDGPTIAWFKDPSGNILSVVEQKAA
jgi:catechol 2,3-dioxygenase-like lactoylglutathione lyase family enzyme